MSGDHKEDRTDNADTGGKYHHTDPLAADQPAKEDTNHRIYIFKGDSHFRPGVHEQPEIAGIRDDAAEKHQSGKSKPAFRASVNECVIALTR